MKHKNKTKTATTK